MKHFALLLFIALLLGGCKNKDVQQHQSGTQDTTISPKKQSAGITRGQTDSLLQTWLFSQNSGNFDLYAFLYAPKFDGIKRSGKKKYTFNQSSWLKDRKRMFAKKMIVAAQDPSVTLIGNMALVRFNQTWETKGYKDRGPKELQLLMFADGSVKIIREEMLSSIRDSVKESRAVDDFRFIIEDSLLVLDRSPSLSLADGAPYLSDMSNIAFNAVQTDQFDDSYKRLMESHWLVISEKDTFTTTLTSVFLVARATPHFGTIQQWNENNTSDDTIAQELWDMAKERDGIVLAGKLDRHYRGAIYAIPASGPVPKFYTVSLDSSYYDMALSALKEMPLYESIQKDFIDYEEVGEWIDEATVQYSVFTHPDDSSTYVALKIYAGVGCGSFYGEMFAIFRINGDSIELISNPDGITGNDMNDCFPKEATDLDNDGDPEFFDNSKIIRNTGSYWDIDEEIIVPFYDCGC